MDMDMHKLDGTGKKRWGWGAIAGLTMALAITAPSIAQNVQNMSLGRGFRDDPATMKGTAGGRVSLASIAGITDNCRGFANTAPNHTVTLTDNFPALDILVRPDNINDDPTLLIKGSNGDILCADEEGGGRRPQINSRLVKGSYQIWVGSKTPNQSFNYTLSLSEARQK
jgi:hypothetical protein